MQGGSQEYEAPQLHHSKMPTIPLIVHRKFTKYLFDLFLESRPQGISQRTVESYHYTLTGFISYSLTTEGIRQYLNHLSCCNGKLKFYSCLRTLFGWLHQNDYIPNNPIKRVAPPKTQKKLLSAISKEQRDILLTRNAVTIIHFAYPLCFHRIRWSMLDSATFSFSGVSGGLTH